MDAYHNFNFTTSYPSLESVYDFTSKKLTANKTKINLVITHGKCPDGFMSAAIVKKWLNENDVDTKKVEFFHAGHNYDFTKLIESMTDKYVIICDFSFKKEIFDKMVEKTKGNILMLDHHKTAQIGLKDVDPQYLTFDMNHCGAFITWTYFYGFNNIPKAVLYVEDNDIWLKALPFTREFTSYLYTREFEFEEYLKFFNDNYITDVMIPIGSGMVIQNDTYIELLGKQTTPMFMLIGGRYYFVAHLNSSVLRSEIGNNILKVLTNANFSAIFSHDPFKNGTSISLRSHDDKTDSSEISKLNGGGGHRNASAMFVNSIVHNVPGRIIDQSRVYHTLNELYVRIIDRFNLLFLNSSVCQKHLAIYLMQERYFGDEKDKKNEVRKANGQIGYQEGMFCIRNNLKLAIYDEVIDGAIVYSYNGYKSEFTAKAKFTNDLTQKIKAKENDSFKVNETNIVTITHKSSSVEDFESMIKYFVCLL